MLFIKKPLKTNTTGKQSNTTDKGQQLKKIHLCRTPNWNSEKKVKPINTGQ